MVVGKRRLGGIRGRSRTNTLLALCFVFFAFISHCSPEFCSHTNKLKLEAFTPGYRPATLKSNVRAEQSHCKRVNPITLRPPRLRKGPASLQLAPFTLDTKSRFHPRTSPCLQQARGQADPLPRQVHNDSVVIHLDVPLGRGSYGDVYEASITSEPSVPAVAKRAVDRFSFAIEEGSAGPGTWSTQDSPAAAFLKVEEEINMLVSEECPHVAAQFFGACEKDGDRWLMWRYEGRHTLDGLLNTAAAEDSLDCIASALGLEGGEEEEGEKQLEKIVNEIGKQLLTQLRDLGRSGIAHRDLKPQNILVCEDGALKLIDFGAAAAMGRPDRLGFDENNSPGDLRYGAPEIDIDQEHWEVFDSYAVGLILVRVLFKPLWHGRVFGQFVRGFRAAGLSMEGWLASLLEQKDRDPTSTSLSIAQYLELAGDVCFFHDDDDDDDDDDGMIKQMPQDIDLCALVEGLQVLSQRSEEAGDGASDGEEGEGGGFWWRAVLGLLAPTAAMRLKPEQALTLWDTRDV